ncbi:TPA: WxL domain-containing protein [Enterococcus faecalis]|uniref:WxL domain-containing protein n=1 Tax=Enterococcus faecalis TaxID=1351 RepID=UPI0002E0CF1E|nr:WxL domain-containing protein [Enterococcus faecalis]MDU1451433.1 WxL domain-containing protein [Enterococcus faecalis]HBI1770664.1 WxL domain-containing protein [Enterococcus faecalis]HBI1794089.1 WxL domain-containing protein [Enterococcus faecalis]HBI1800811.1 WxL domain-containing protein [Enterococcus faecalis]HBI1803562.1 WxL domain-containing protein [Enterococcus faecalis]
MKKSKPLFLLVILLMNATVPYVTFADEITIDSEINQSSESSNVLSSDSKTSETQTAESEVQGTDVPPQTSSEKLPSISNREELSSTDNKDDKEQNIEKEKEVKDSEKSKIVSIDDIGLPNDFEEPDKKGSYIGGLINIPLRVGILSQPQEEQYLVEGTTADLSVVTTSYLPPLGSTVEARVDQWTFQSDSGSWSNKKEIGKFTGKGSGIFGTRKQTINIPIEGLSEGVYYFQVKAKLRRLGALLTTNYYSQLAKVEVKKEHINAESISVSTPKVIFENADYSAKAVTNPKDATSEIHWGSTLADLEFSSMTGRNVEFGTEKQLPDINTDTQMPGIPFHIAANAVNNDGTKVSDYSTVYLGGLAAKEVSRDSGFSWEVDSQGLADLNESLESSNVWTYKWEYIDENGTHEFSSKDGLKNFSGTIQNLTDLNDRSNLLTFDKNSKFMEQAEELTNQGKPYAVQVTFSTVVETDEKKNETVKITSNKAQLRVNESDGKLSLTHVPNFKFGVLPASTIYEGTKENEPEANDLLEITDSRYDTPGWILNAHLSQFRSDQEHTLAEKSKLRMISYPIDISLLDDNEPHYIVDSKSSESFDMLGKLHLEASPNASISNGEVFSATITWELVSASVKVDAVQ